MKKEIKIRWHCYPCARTIEAHGGNLAVHKRSKQHILNLANAKSERRRTDITKERFDGVTWRTI